MNLSLSFNNVGSYYTYVVIFDFFSFKKLLVELKRYFEKIFSSAYEFVASKYNGTPQFTTFLQDCKSTQNLIFLI